MFFLKDYRGLFFSYISADSLKLMDRSNAMTTKDSKPKPAGRWLGYLLGPNPRIADSEDRHAARLFASIMLVHIIMVLIGIGVTDFVFRVWLGTTMMTGNDFTVILAGVGLIAVALLFLRSGYFLPGIWLYIAVTAGVALTAPFVVKTNSEMVLLGTAIIPVLLTAMVFSYRWLGVVILAVVSLAILQLVITPMSPRVFVTGVTALVVVFVTSILVIVFKYFLGLLEHIRLEALQTSELNYRHLFENVVDGIFIVSGKGRLLEVNSAACTQLGYSREQLLTMSFDDISGPPGSWKGTADLVHSRGILQLETSHSRQDGIMLPVELTVSATNYHGQGAYLGVSRDISERRRVAKEKKAFEQQLQQAMKMESLGRMAGGVAHDFNNLLTVILGNVDMAALSPGNAASMSGALDEIRKAAISAAGLTRQLLAFSRKEIIEPRLCNLNELIGHIHKMIGRLLGEDVALNTRFEEKIGLVMVDPSVIEQVIVNLAINARDAMPRGGRLMIETQNTILDREYSASHPLTRPGRYVMVTVSDDGEGMSAETKQHLFEPFYSTKPVGQGTGLGLATSYGAISQCGGTIEIYSELGHGTTFKIYFPRADAQDCPADEPSGLPALQTGTETILLVEDEIQVRNFTAQFLPTLGYSVLAAASAEAAIDLAREHKEPIQLLLTDVVLPGLNGRQLAGQLKQLHPETKVLYTSGYTANIIAHHGILDEGVALIQKPYSTRDLAIRIRAVLDSGAHET